MTSMRQRAQGAWMGQLCGDALGSLVEFSDPDQIRQDFPDGVRDMAVSPVFGTLPGQPTDDSEMAMALARRLIAHGDFDVDAVFSAYLAWLQSGPFDVGTTVRDGLRGRPRPDSQANGAMMRVSPIGIFGAALPLHEVANMARQDARLTHVNVIVGEANALFAMAIAHAVANGLTAEALYGCIRGWASEHHVDASLLAVIEAAASHRPVSYTESEGWLMIALQNALWQLRHASSVEEAIIDTVHQGGDTDTNAAICGALLGAVHGIDALPRRWQQAVLDCKPEAGGEGVRQPRPALYWPGDALELPLQLLAAGQVRAVR